MAELIARVLLYELLGLAFASSLLIGLVWLKVRIFGAVNDA